MLAPQLARNERGLLTLDIVFSLLLVCATGVVLFALSFTLTAVEVAQYVAFSSSREYFASDVTEDEQAKSAKAKFDDLMTKPGIKQILKRNWFEVKVDKFGDLSGEYNAQNPKEQQDFVGTRLSFTSKMLNIQIPFYGSTSSNDRGFTTFITSFIGREPSQGDCRAFYAGRWNAMSNTGGFGVGRPPENSIQEDNGC